MAYIEVRKYGISGVFIDGYMPDFSKLKKIDWDRAFEQVFDKFPWARDQSNKIRKRLEPSSRDYGPLIRSAIYSKLIDNTKLGFCPYTDRRNWPCHHWFHPSKGPMAMKYCFASHLNISPEEAVDIFNADTEAEMAKGKGEYASLITVVDHRPEIGCQVQKECNENWMNFVLFEPKRKKDHSNFEAIKPLVKKILIDHMIMLESEYFDDRRLSDFFGQFR